MAEGLLSRLARQYRAAVLPTFQRKSLLSLFPSEIIGGRDITKWAIKVMKEQNAPTVTPAGTAFNGGEDKFEIADGELELYKFNKRIPMTRSEMALFEKNGILPAGMEETGSAMAKEINYWFARGKRQGSQWDFTQYNYLTDSGTGTNSTVYSRPQIITQATSGHWKDAGFQQTDITNLVAQMEIYGFNPKTSVMLYPEVASAKMRNPVILSSTNVYGGVSVMDFALSQGILGAMPVKDELLYTLAGATPTAALFDLYLVDLNSVTIGYTVPENVNVQSNPDGSYNTYLDTEIEFCPLFRPKKYDDSNGYIYKGVSRITAIDTNS